MDMITTTEALAAFCTPPCKATTMSPLTPEFLRRDDPYWPELCLIQMAGPEDEGNPCRPPCARRP